MSGTNGNFYLRSISFGFLLLILFNCENEKKRMELINAANSNVVFENTVENTQKLNILNYLYFYNGAGVAAGDFNNDGLPDLYFVANQGPDKLYLNKGDLTFEDITERSGINNSSSWSTGVSTVDINQDGLLDIYICKLGGFQNFDSSNILYINKGNDENGIPVFKEEANSYGLDLKTMATRTVFFDFDLDNDLDMFLLNHSVYPNRSYGKGEQRKSVDSISGDRLYENRNGKFVDVSSEKGIFQGRIGYGLGISVGDVNDDNYPDIYIGNDFFENDYFYINSEGEQFEEIISKNESALGHTTHFSMGNSIVDLNNDALPEILSLDMLPEDLQTYKTSAQEYNYQIYSNYLRNGYAPQFMQNTLHWNRGDDLQFSETSYLSGLDATEWSWAIVSADLNNDKLDDLYITNGILGATNDMDFINFIADESIQKELGNGVDAEEQKFIERIPKKFTTNYLFKNEGALKFKNLTGDWIESKPSYSNGAVAADLDLDGDMELIVNCVNASPLIYKNNSEEMNEENKWLKIRFAGPELNRNGIGTKVKIFLDDEVLMKQFFPNSTYLSSSHDPLHFGLGNRNSIDSLKIIWPDSKVEHVYQIASNQTLTLEYSNAVEEAKALRPENRLFEKDSLGISLIHTDNIGIEFNREPLIPFSGSSHGPDILVSDLNGDNLDDVFICNGKGTASQLWYQTVNGTFELVQKELFEQDKLREDISAKAADFNGDGLIDLVLASGGNEFEEGENIQPRVYINSTEGFTKKSYALNGIEINASDMVVFDFENDGDIDIVVGSNQKGVKFAESSSQLLLLNDGSGVFTNATASNAPDLLQIDHISSIAVADLDKNGFEDILAVGYWSTPMIFLNDGEKLQLKEIEGFKNSEGFWNVVKAFDYDNDGDLDIIAGNWGQNSRLKATKDFPIKLYRSDFDNNGTIDPLLTYFYNGKETTFSSKEDLAKQMPFINKDYLSFKEFAKADLNEIFGKQKLKNAEIKKVKELSTCLFINDGNLNFKKLMLPDEAQISSVHSILLEDINSDGFQDPLLTGNYYEISTQLSRLDASRGELFLNNNKEGFTFVQSTGMGLQGVIRDLDFITIGSEKFIIVGRNNSKAEFYKILK